MNPLQMALQIRHKLRTVAWTTGSAEVVFGTRAVHIYAGSPTEEQIPPGFPWALVGLDSGSADIDDPDLITQRFTVLVATEVAADPEGELAVIGGSVADLGRSVGRGVGEVAERARAAVQDLTGADGAKIQIAATSYSSTSVLGRGRHIAMAEMSLEALCTSQPHYAAPQRIAWATNLWSWAGTHCSNRFDFLQYRLVRKAGSTPSANPSDGTVVYTGTAASFVGAKTGGNVYTVFADYNGRGGSTVEASSDPEVGAYLT